MDTTLNQPPPERGPWPTSTAIAVALVPVVVAIAALVAADRRVNVGPLAWTDLVYWVVIPLGALYPTIAAVSRRMAYAPMTVVVVTSMAPAFVYATRLLLDPLPKDALGRPEITPSVVVNIALPPALLAVGLFVSIEIASAAIRRGVAVGVFGAMIAAVVLGAAVAGPLLVGPITFGG
jgi:hypothetical protein